MDVEGEIRDLKRRVGELEGGFGFLTQQVRTVHLDLLGSRARPTQRFDKVEAGSTRSKVVWTVEGADASRRKSPVCARNCRRLSAT